MKYEGKLEKARRNVLAKLEAISTSVFERLASMPGKQDPEQPTARWPCREPGSEQLTLTQGAIVHSVPADGNCMSPSLLYKNEKKVPMGSAAAEWGEVRR